MGTTLLSCGGKNTTFPEKADVYFLRIKSAGLSLLKRVRCSTGSEFVYAARGWPSFQSQWDQNWTDTGITMGWLFCKRKEDVLRLGFQNVTLIRSTFKLLSFLKDILKQSSFKQIFQPFKDEISPVFYRPRGELSANSKCFSVAESGFFPHKHFVQKMLPSDSTRSIPRESAIF